MEPYSDISHLNISISDKHAKFHYIHVRQGDMTVGYLQHGGWAFRHAWTLVKTSNFWKDTTGTTTKRDFQVTTHFERGGDQVKVKEKSTWIAMCGMKMNIWDTAVGFLFEQTSHPTPYVKKAWCYTVLTLFITFNPSRRPYSTECIWIVNWTPVGTLDVLGEGKG